MGQNAAQNLADDMTTLFAGIDPSSMWITRFEGDLTRAALGADLQIAAASDQSQVQRFLTATLTSGTAPSCPAPTPCGGEGGFGGSIGTGFPWWGNGSGGSSAGGGGCATSGGDGTSALFGSAAVLAALAYARRRRVAGRVVSAR